jgi:hypothetical protein
MVQNSACGAEPPLCFPSRAGWPHCGVRVACVTRCKVMPHGCAIKLCTFGVSIVYALEERLVVSLRFRRVRASRRCNMPQALPLPLREQIVERHQQGEPLKGISQTSQIPYHTVLVCWRRYCLDSQEGLANHYDRCGPQGPKYPQDLINQALDLKRVHARWGGGLVRVQLAETFPDQPLPAVRTLQTWFRKAHLQPVRAEQPPVQKDRGRRPHDVWQIDAKERMHLGDQSGTSVLTVTDEASGALLGVVPFPPVSLVSGPNVSGAGEPEHSVRTMGLAFSDPRGQRGALGLLGRSSHRSGSMVDRIGDRTHLEPSALSEGKPLRRTL